MAGLAAAALPLPPAHALRHLEIRLPELDTSFTVDLDELTDASSLWSGDSDIAELDRATNGAIGRRLLEMFNAPMPISPAARAGLRMSVGSPLLRQALLVARTLIGVEGISDEERRDGRQLLEAIERAESGGTVTLRTLLKGLPGETASIDLGVALRAIRRLRGQQSRARDLLMRVPPATQDPALSSAGPQAVDQQLVRLPVPHRQDDLAISLLQPATSANGRLVLISHGLWDSPDSFAGWGRHLASHGYTVLLPQHPGSDQDQQQAMLSGQAEPPTPEELRFRPLDISAILDAAASGRLGGVGVLDTDHVVVLGHSWGATTAMQLAGLRFSSRQLAELCDQVWHPERNVSWALQCSFLSSADRASLADERVMAAVAVSPPLRLLFDRDAREAINGRLLLVSGSRDWVVPSDPEAINPFLTQDEDVGHRLVLAEAGDHFNLRGVREDGGVLRGLLLAWVNGAFANRDRARPGVNAPDLLPADGWGNSFIPLVNVTPALLR